MGKTNLPQPTAQGNFKVGDEITAKFKNHLDQELTVTGQIHEIKNDVLCCKDQETGRSFAVNSDEVVSCQKVDVAQNNLIERLGGYEGARNKCEELHDLDTFNLSGELYAKSYLEDELLEYRREHGIFEIDDFVIDQEKLVKLQSVGNFKFVGLLHDGSIWHGNVSDLKHTTTQEIQAGHRINLSNSTPLESLGDDAHIENHVSPLCIVNDSGVGK